ncbi:hypothetical protein ES703_43793 [subsurface metagenome]
MPRIEIELSDELHAKLETVASKMALAPSEMAKFILADGLAREKLIDWLSLINKGREALARITQQAKK